MKNKADKIRLAGKSFSDYTKKGTVTMTENKDQKAAQIIR